MKLLIHLHSINSSPIESKSRQAFSTHLKDKYCETTFAFIIRKNDEKQFDRKTMTALESCRDNPSLVSDTLTSKFEKISYVCTECAKKCVNFLKDSIKQTRFLCTFFAHHKKFHKQGTSRRTYHF